METMLVGEFKKGLLSSGLEAELVDTKISENGIIKPLYEIKGQNVMKYLPANKTHTGDGPLISDPMEEKFYYVGNSSIEGAGRGMFLKKNAVKGQIVGFYNGVRMTDLESKVHRFCHLGLSERILYKVLFYFRLKLSQEKVNTELTMIGPNPQKYWTFQSNLGT